MNRHLLSGSATLAVAALLAMAVASPAAARIECRGNFQITQIWSDRDALLRGRDRSRASLRAME